MRIGFFTAGSVGAGHLVRGVALERALRRVGFGGEYRMFGPALPFAAAARLGYETVPLEEGLLRDAVRAPESALARVLSRFQPDVLLVDLFWAPVHHLLPHLRCEAWLLVRCCPRAWFGGPPDTRWDPARFARIIGIEPLPHAAIRERVEPVVVCNPEECRPPGALRAHLEVPPGRPLVVAMHAGLPGEMAALAKAGGHGVVTCDLYTESALFPVAEWLRDADGVFAGAGYNSFWEARWLGWFERTVFTPFPRAVDNQGWRLATCSTYRMQQNGADTLARWLTSGR